jgi:hypothetical protein
MEGELNKCSKKPWDIHLKSVVFSIQMLLLLRLLRSWASLPFQARSENSLDRYCYAVEKDLVFIVERTTNTDVGFDNLLKRHNKPWRVRRVNLCLDHAMMGHDVTHLGIIDVAFFVKDDYMTHGMHLNSLDKRRLMHLIAE